MLRPAMALSLVIPTCLLLLRFGAICQAATVTYDFNITWVLANPDGALERPVIGINGQWPLPAISVTKGDRVVVNVDNQLGNQTTSLHFHGLFQNGTTQMDGPVGVTQCAIPPGASMTYNFTIGQPGTYWYHSHSSGQYPDGLRAPLIVHDAESPYQNQYDEEIILSMSDWYHDQMPPLLAKFVSVANPRGAEPIPDAALFNDSQNVTVSVQPGKTYLFRMINMAAFASQYLWFEGHTMRIVEVDGVYTEPAEASMLYFTPGQRYSVLITMKNDTSSNFAFMGSMDTALFDKVPARLNPNVTGWLVYDEQAKLPTPAIVDGFNSFDDMTLLPQDGTELFNEVDHSITMNMKMGVLGNGANYAFVNDVTYLTPKVPTLYTVLSSGSEATNAAIYGANTNAFVLNKGDIVEIVLNNQDTNRHPFHLHGHEFQAIWRSAPNAGSYIDNVTLSAVPMRRDTLMVEPSGNFVIRFRADNPGVWMFHCHIEWHVASGLVAVMVEAPTELQAALTIPQDHWQVCARTNTPTRGNAAGITVDLLDLSGAPKPPAALPDGFTPRGIVALAFSTLSGLLGVAVIAWYGAAPLGPSGGGKKSRAPAVRGSGSFSLPGWFKKLY